MKEYPKGIYFNKKRDNAPDFVLGSLSIKKADFLTWLESKQENDKGYINLDVLNGKDGSPYLAVNDYKKATNQEKEEIRIEDVPF